MDANQVRKIAELDQIVEVKITNSKIHVGHIDYIDRNNWYFVMVIDTDMKVFEIIPLNTVEWVKILFS